MDRNINNYKQIKPNESTGSTTDEKINMMKKMLLDSEKCKEIALKLCAYISQ